MYLIGDLPTDIECAINAGVKSIALLSGHGTQTDLEMANPSVILREIKEILEIEKEMEEKNMEDKENKETKITQEEIDPAEQEQDKEEKIKDYKDTEAGKAGDELFPDAEQTDVKTQLIGKKIIAMDFAELHSAQYNNDYLVVLAKLNDEEVCGNELEAEISQDVALSYRLLRTVNSAFYALPRKVDSIKQAVTYIGQSATKNLATLLKD